MNANQAIDRMRQVIRLQHKALATEDSYVLWLRRYMKALRQIPPQLSSEKKLEKFLTDLALDHDVSASTQNQAFNAILFFYRHIITFTFPAPSLRSLPYLPLNFRSGASRIGPTARWPC